MPVKHIRCVDIVYEVPGDSGPWVTVTPGGRRGLEGERAVAGLSPEAMRKMTLPAIIIPGNDRVHPPGPGQAAHRLLPKSIYQEVLTQQVDADVDFDGWARATGTLAGRFIDFLRAQERQ
jgi:hypothetical protein